MSHAVRKVGNPSQELIKAIAADIGKEVYHRIEVMYPQAIAACPSTFRIHVQNSVFNEIMAALEVSDEGKVIARLNERKAFRRKLSAQYRKLRSAPTSGSEREGR